MIVAASQDAITMVEGGMEEASEADIVEGLEFGFQAAQPLIQLQLDLIAEVGKAKMAVVEGEDHSALYDQVAANRYNLSLVELGVRPGFCLIVYLKVFVSN